MILEASCDHLLASSIVVLLTVGLRILDATFVYLALLSVTSQSTIIDHADAHVTIYASLTIHVCVQALLKSPIFFYHFTCDEGQLDDV